MTVAATVHPAQRERAALLAQRLGAPLVSEEDARDLTRLFVGEEQVELLRPGVKPGRGVFADFSAVDVRPGRKQPLAKAIGAKSRLVLDATAGLGQDAFLLACLGHEVLAVERSPVIFALLEDAVMRAHADARLREALGDRLKAMHADALRLAVGDDPDAAELLHLALVTAKRRVVVKRPTHAAPLRDSPTMSFEGKLARYDVWVVPNTD